MDSARQMEQKRSLVEPASFQDTLRNEETASEICSSGVVVFGGGSHMIFLVMLEWT